MQGPTYELACWLGELLVGGLRTESLIGLLSFFLPIGQHMKP